MRFLGRAHPSELPSLYAGAIATLVPSIGYEVFGIVLLESFAQRTPAIVHDLGALPEVVEEAGGGLVYRTQAELLGALELLATDTTRRDELGRSVAADRYQRPFELNSGMGAFSNLGKSLNLEALSVVEADRWAGRRRLGDWI